METELGIEATSTTPLLRQSQSSTNHSTYDNHEDVNGRGGVEVEEDEDGFLDNSDLDRGNLDPSQNDPEMTMHAQTPILSAATLRAYLLSDVLLSLPQLVLIFIVLLWKWNEEECDDAYLHSWAIVYGVKTSVSLLLAITSYDLNMSRIRNLQIQQTWQDRSRNATLLRAQVIWLKRVRNLLDNFGLIWLVVGNFWLFQSKDHCLDSAPTVFILDCVLVYLNLFVLFLPCILFALFIPFVCLCFPCLIHLLRWLDLDNKPKAATKQQIEELPAIPFKDDGSFTYDALEKLFLNNEIQKESDLEGGNQSKSEMKIEEKCAICLNDYVVDEVVRVLPCIHHFHQKCCDEWLLINGTCPVCRKAISKSITAETGEESNIEQISAETHEESNIEQTSAEALPPADSS